MVTLFSAGNTNYTRNGDMALLPYSAEMHVILNSTWELTIKHPVDTEGRWAYIEPDSVVRVPTFLTDTSDGVLNGLSLWRIIEVEKTDDEITATAQPIFYDAASCLFYTDTRPTDKTGQEALDWLLTNYDGYSADKYSFTAESDIETTATAYYQYVNFLEAVNGDIDQSFVNRWGGEITYDNFTIRINENAGSDSGVEIRYGKNIPENGFNITEDYSGIYTRIYPKGYNGITPTDLYVDSENIANYETIRAVTITYDNIRSADDCTPEYDDDGNITGYAEEDDDDIIICETQDEIDAALTAAAEAEFENGLDEPSTTIECDLVLLGDTEQYKDFEGLETVTLGDTVTIKNTHLGYTTSAEVVELTFDALTKRVTAVTLGNYATTYFNTIAGTVAALSSSVTTINNSISTLSSSTTSSLSTLADTVAALESTSADEIATLQTALETLAAADDLTTLEKTVSSLADTVTTIGENYVSTSYLKTNYITADAIEATYATIEVLKTDYISTSYLTTNYITADTIKSTYATIDYLKSYAIEASTITADLAVINQVFAGVTTTDAELTYYELVGTAEICDAWIGDLNSASITTDVLIATVADVETLTADAVTVSELSAVSAQIENLEVDIADIDSAYIAELVSSNAEVINLSVVSEYVLCLMAYGITVNMLSATNAYITTLTSKSITTDTLIAAVADVETLTADAVTVSELSAVSAQIENLEVDIADIDSAYIAELVSSNAEVISLSVVSEYVLCLMAYGITVNMLSATNAYITTLTSKSITTDTLIAAVADVETLTADAVTVSELSAVSAQIENLEVDIADIDSAYIAELVSSNAEVINLSVVSEYVLCLMAYGITVNMLSATNAYITTLTSKSITADTLVATLAEVDTLLADYAEVQTLIANCIEAGTLSADYAEISALEAIATVTTSLDATYADISFSNVDLETVGTEFVQNFLIAGNIISESATVDTLSVTNYLTGVYIVADVITAGTLSCERLVITGEDSIVYEINATSAGLTATELEEEQYQNYINGTTLVANSITASQIAAGTITANEIAAGTITANEIAAGTITANEIAAGTITANEIAAGTITANEIAAGAITASKIDVTDLSAIGATIGGFEITTNALHSEYTDSDGSTFYSGLYCSSSVDENTVAFYAGAINTAGAGAVFSVTYGGAITSTGGTVSTVIDSGIIAFDYNGTEVATIKSYMATDDITGLSIETITTGEEGSYITMTAGVILVGDEGKTVFSTITGVYACIYGTGYTIVGDSDSPTYIKGSTYFDSYIYIDNEEKICLYGNDGSAVVGQIYVTSGNGYNVASTNAPIYVYGTITYLGSNNYGATYIRGQDVYVGTTSYETTLRGSSIIFDSTVSSDIKFAAGYGVAFYDSDSNAYGYLGMFTSTGGALILMDYSGDGLFLYSGGGLKLYGGDILLDEDTFFSENIYLNNGNYIYWYDSDDTAVQVLYFGTSDTLYLGAANYDTTLQGSTLTIGTSSDIVFSGEISSHLYMLNSKAVYGYYDGTYYQMLIMGASGRVYLGDSTSTLPTYIRGKSIYMNGSAYSSDIRYKNSVAEIHDGYIELIDKLMPRRFKYNWDNENYYNGFVAQEVITALNECGIDDNALIRYDNDANRYAIDYNGILTALVAAYQKLNKRVKALEED